MFLVFLFFSLNFAHQSRGNDSFAAMRERYDVIAALLPHVCEFLALLRKGKENPPETQEMRQKMGEDCDVHFYSQFSTLSPLSSGLLAQPQEVAGKNG